MKLAGTIAENEKWYNKLQILGEYSFWVFAAHVPIVLPIMKKLGLQFISVNPAGILLQFFGIAVLCVVFLLGLGMLTKKYCPKIFALLSGGR
jgi:hypothetical protein